MKQKLFFVLALIAALAGGCVSNKNSAPAPAIPSGTFEGLFRRVHTSSKNGVRDTVKANVQLVLNKTSGFTLTPDNTTSIIVASHGGYVIESTYILFNDVTYQVTTGTTDKVHLTGTYQYYYDGKVFQMANNSFLDTLSLQFDLKKQN
ncbi:MAG: hypothetical protein JWR02_612 [Mucilaginibacter sp.]|nr:hypothetical protein [Mucilaginibacter sp.]